MSNRRIAIGSDHRGLPLKQVIISLLTELGHDSRDMGSYDGDPTDYPDIAEKVATTVAKREADYGMLICATGIGMSIAANKVPGVRAALCTDTVSAQMARRHNDSNVLCLGGEMIGEWLAKEITLAYLSAEFEGDRHARRVEKISQLENQLMSEKV